MFGKTNEKQYISTLTNHDVALVKRYLDEVKPVLEIHTSER